MSNIYEKIDNRLETFLSTLKRFPLASFSAFLFTIIMLVLIDYKNYANPNAIMASKIAFVSTLGIVLFPALQLLGRSIIFPLLGIVLLAIYYYFLPQNIDNMSMTIGLRHILLAIALFLMILWSPFIFRRSDNDTFWQYAQTIIFGLIIAIFFSAIIYAGLAAALYAIETLFHFDVNSIRYAQLALIVFGIFGINFFLSQIPKHPLFMQVRPYSKIKRIFSKNILAPIAIFYFVILYAYTAKILLSMTYPSGILSWIIVAFSFVAIVSFLFLSPYLKKSNLTQRFIWLAIFLQTIMLGMALWMRVEEYGITYNRYLLGMFGLWLVLMSLYFMLFGKAQQKWLFFFATLMILVSQFGEYSATNITKKSQTSRLVQLIATADPRSEELNMKRKYEISDGIHYINKHYGIDAFEKIIPHILKKFKASNKIEDTIKQYNFPSFATKKLGFKFVDKWEWLDFEQKNDKKRISYYSFYNESSEDSINIGGYTHLINYNNTQDYKILKKSHKHNASDLMISFRKNKLFLKENNITTLFDLNDYAKELMVEGNEAHNFLNNLPLYVNKNDNLSIKIVFKNLTISSKREIIDFSSQILLKF